MEEELKTEIFELELKISEISGERDLALLTVSQLEAKVAKLTKELEECRMDSLKQFMQ